MSEKKNKSAEEESKEGSGHLSRRGFLAVLPTSGIRRLYWRLLKL